MYCLLSHKLHYVIIFILFPGQNTEISHEDEANTRKIRNGDRTFNQGLASSVRRLCAKL